MRNKLFGKSEVLEFERVIAQKDSIIKNERLAKLRFQSENEELKREIKRLQAIIETPKLHNERNAGRKTRFTYEVIGIIEIMYYGKKGVAAIKKELEKSTGETWSRSTIEYFIHTRLQNRK